jgi:hypothetical protein
MAMIAVILIRLAVVHPSKLIFGLCGGQDVDIK